MPLEKVDDLEYQRKPDRLGTVEWRRAARGTVATACPVRDVSFGRAQPVPPPLALLAESLKSASRQLCECETTETPLARRKGDEGGRRCPLNREVARPPTTLLAAKIRDLGMTLEEFVSYAEEFAREHGERGTISVRHLQRLLSPRQQPAALRPATRRLLEAVFSAPIAELMAPPRRLAPECRSLRDGRATMGGWEHQAAEVARLVATSSRVDPETLDLLASQVENTRRLDRRFGAATCSPRCASTPNKSSTC